MLNAHQEETNSEMIHWRELAGLMFLTRSDAIASLKWFISTFIGSALLVAAVVLNLHSDVAALKRDNAETRKSLEVIVGRQEQYMNTVYMLKTKIDSILLYQKIESNYKRRH